MLKTVLSQEHFCVFPISLFGTKQNKSSFPFWQNVRRGEKNAMRSIKNFFKEEKKEKKKTKEMGLLMRCWARNHPDIDA